MFSSNDEENNYFQKMFESSKEENLLMNKKIANQIEEIDRLQQENKSLKVKMQDFESGPIRAGESGL